MEEKERMLMEDGEEVMGVEFIIKEGMWKINLWIEKEYKDEEENVEEVFEIMRKVGIYVILRM